MQPRRQRKGARMTSRKTHVSRKRTGALVASTPAVTAVTLGMASRAPAPALGEGEQLPAILVFEGELVRHFRLPVLDFDEPAPQGGGVEGAAPLVGRED